MDKVYFDDSFLEKVAMEIAKPKRECGSCTLCCKLVPVSAIGKPANKWCDHCDKPRGCLIYETRPLSCRLWSCSWLLDLTLPPEMEPRKCHVVVDMMPDEVSLYDHVLQKRIMKQVVQMWVDPAYPKAWEADAVLKAIDHYGKLLKMGTLVRFGNERAIYVVPPSLSHDGAWHRSDSGLAKTREDFNKENVGVPRV